ncbi:MULTISPECIES: hypothetical protein [unclassified Imperialibacter]|uniref:hypothetical protein n=1 Tax=unclassified Imperialibacter TaxID=2629706 RepID=UPI0012589BAF|nr:MULTISPECIES: hypothetical protein [unclassified Imperialibacter]CAD5246132.1 hypothetical protein IMPERIA75_10027 [Imperialibacter sp. 75]CAD5246157.1 hypothetical protein IMPERIA89_10027 [Imperialibacter sp. 89]VVS95992.1 conserved hypothetical protein [Imperialibacter sp. EC-SDR9]
MIETKSIETGVSKAIDIEDVLNVKKIGFRDFNVDIDAETNSDDATPNRRKLLLDRKKTYEDSSVALALFFGDEYAIDVSSSSENKINLERQEVLKSKFTKDLSKCLEEEEFEFGYKSKSESIIKKQFEINALVTKNWLNEIFIENFQNEKILIGLLRILGRFSEEIIFPQGQTMALAALMHKNDEIKELGIRAFENWNSQTSLQVLKNIEVEVKWLKDYLSQVIKDLEKEYVSVN